MEERLKKLEDNKTESPYTRALIAEMTAQTGLMNVINSDVVAGFIKIVKANKLLKRNFKEYPDFFLNKKLYGVFNVGIGNIPPSVKWATNFLGLTGDTDSGFEYLESYKNEVENRPALFAECLIYMVFAYQICGDDQGTYEMLKENYPLAVPTTLGTYLYANTLDRVAKTEESLELLSELELDKDRSTFFPIILLTGKGKLNRLDNDADEPYLYYLKNSKNENYKKESCNKLSLHYLIQNQEDKYDYYKTEAKKIDREVMRPDREAEVDIKRININMELSKASLLSNGGYFEKSWIPFYPI